MSLLKMKLLYLSFFLPKCSMTTQKISYSTLKTFCCLLLRLGLIVVLIEPPMLSEKRSSCFCSTLEQKDERTFLTLYWMHLVIILVVSILSSILLVIFWSFENKVEKLSFLGSVIRRFRRIANMFDTSWWTGIFGKFVFSIECEIYLQNDI